jgi:hypothetical protein
VNRLARLTAPYASLARRVLPIAALVTLVVITAQFLFAGAMFFGADFGFEGRDAHFWTGGVIHALLGLLLFAALVGRQPRTALAINAVLFLIATTMMALPRASSAEVQAFHPVGAVLVAWLTYEVYRRSRAVQAEALAEAPEMSAVATPNL